MFGVDASEGRYTRRIRVPPYDDVTGHSSRISTETLERDILDEYNTFNSCSYASLALNFARVRYNFDRRELR